LLAETRFFQELSLGKILIYEYCPHFYKPIFFFKRKEYEKYKSGSFTFFKLAYLKATQDFYWRFPLV